MVVGKNRSRQNGCRQIKSRQTRILLNYNGMHIICTFEISICFVNWNRVERLANILASSYQIWYHLKLPYNLDGTNWVLVFVHSTVLPI